MQKITNYINGELTAPLGDAYLDNIEPATGKPYSLVPDSDARDVNLAVEAAQKAFPAWSKMPAADRSRIMFRIADIIEARLDEIARAETIDNGKPLSLARSLDIPRCSANLKFYASAAQNFHSETFKSDVALNYILRGPRGVAGIISPWNLPLYLLTWKIAPALATGNTVVAKPSELTPMTAFLFSKICIEAGLPPGVLNIVHGLGSKAGAALTAHPNVPTISFTGGTVTGGEIAKTCAPLFKKYSLELGGKNPNIVFADADMDEVVKGSVKAAFANQGQVCLCGSRIFVEESIYPAFVDKFTAAAAALKIGDPLESGTDQGAMVSKAQLDKTKFYVDLAKQEGGKIRLGGKPPAELPARCKDGYFFTPTVITDLGVNCRVNKEEIFGPVATIMPFKDEAQVAEYANATDYGLSASIWTQNVKRAHRLADQIQAGTVWVNCWMIRDLRAPFGGMKKSGVGREGGEEALRFFTEPKNVCVASS
jgi:aminomuconate-semialdehyde/2-hydroxymuconate-6-semialdehyde dehydrogenase